MCINCYNKYCPRPIRRRPTRKKIIKTGIKLAILSVTVSCLRDIAFDKCFYDVAISRRVTQWLCLFCLYKQYVYQLHVTVICMEFGGLRQTVIITGVFSLSFSPESSCTVCGCNVSLCPQTLLTTAHTACTRTLTTTTAYGLLHSLYYRMSSLADKLKKKKKVRKRAVRFALGNYDRMISMTESKKKKKKSIKLAPS